MPVVEDPLSHAEPATDPADETASTCLKKALEATQLRCPRDGKVADVKTAICL